MDVDLESVEIVFAQKLASGEPTTRQRALRMLHEWIEDQSKTRPFGEEDMMRLCKGLHYVLWMQDKMLLQEEMADKISGLLLVFSNETERQLFIKCVFKSLSKEWHHIDRWRMDKFLMMMRKVVRVLFEHLKNHGWKKEVREGYWKAFSETVISSDSSFSEGLKFHFASIFLDEMDNAGGPTKKQVSACLKPFSDLLGVKGISNYLFDSILQEVFLTILHQRSEEIAEQEDSEDAMEQQSEGIQFDYKTLGKMLFDIGKRPEVTSARRKKLYDAVKLFEIAAAGGDPYKFEIPKPEVTLTQKDIDEAADKLAEFERGFAEDRLKFKKVPKVTIAEKTSTGDLPKSDSKTKIKKSSEKVKKTITKKGKKGGSKKLKKK